MAKALRREGLRAALLASIAAAGCGAPLDLPQEPEPIGNPLGEVAYVPKYDPWEGLGRIDDLVVTHALVLYGVQDGTRVQSWYPDRAYPNINSDRSIPEDVIVDGDTLRLPVRICEGGGGTLWVAYRSPHPMLVQWVIGAASIMPELVRDDSIRVFGGIASDPDSGFVYVADAGRSTITKYAPSDSGGSLVTQIATPGNGDGFVQEPHGIFFFQDSLLVADTGKGWLQVLDADVPGAGRGQVAGPPDAPLQLRRPLDVWVDDLGYYFVADTGNSRVLKLEKSGAVKEVVNEFDTDAAAAPNTLAASSIVSDMVWVVDPDRGRLTIYKLNTTSEELP